MATSDAGPETVGDISRVTVLGSGVLGSQIAYQTAYSGFHVTVYDISDEILEAARQRLRGLAARYEQEVEGAGGGRGIAALDRITYASDLVVAVQDADLVIEAVPEKLDLKREVYTNLGKAAPPKTIFATNSSTLLPSAMADFTGRPERFLALHFANQIWVSNTAEIMGHPRTDPAVFQAIVGFAREIGMEPIELAKEQPGYILNTLLVPFVKAGLELLVDGVADAATIDRVWRIFARAPEGPFQMIDKIGLNTAYNVSASGDAKSRAIGEYLKEHYIDRGKLGAATGEGFYAYPQPPTDRVRTNRDGLRPEDTNLPYPTHSVVAVVPTEEAARAAVQRLQNDGVQEEDIDLFVGDDGAAWLHNYHHRSGFLGHLRQIAESLGDEGEQSKEYEEALHHGHAVLVVKAPQESAVPTIQHALSEVSATRMRYFGRFTIRDLV